MKSSGLRLFDGAANSGCAPRVAEQVAHSEGRMGEPGCDVKWLRAPVARVDFPRRAANLYRAMSMNRADIGLLDRAGQRVEGEQPRA